MLPATPYSESILELAGMCKPYDEMLIERLFRAVVEEIISDKPDPITELKSYVADKLTHILSLPEPRLDDINVLRIIWNLNQHYVDFSEPDFLKPIRDFYDSYDYLTTVGTEHIIPNLTLKNSEHFFVLAMQQSLKIALA